MFLHFDLHLFIFHEEIRDVLKKKHKDFHQSFIHNSKKLQTTKCLRKKEIKVHYVLDMMGYRGDIINHAFPLSVNSEMVF